MHCQNSVFSMFFENPMPLNMRLRMQPRFVTVDNRVAESEVKYPTLTFQNCQLRLLDIKGMKFGC